MRKRYRDEDSISGENTSFSLDGFVASRERDTGKNAIAGAAQNQLSGRALPSLIPDMGDWHHADDHVRAASHVNPTADLINAALSTEMKAAITKCARIPQWLVFQRQNALSQLENCSLTLTPLRHRWVQRLPEKSPAAAINFPLIYLLMNALEYPDEHFATELSKGMPIAGPIAPTPGLTARKRCAELSYQEWKEGIPARNKKIFDRVLKSQGSELTEICWQKTLSEVEQGWITPPVPVTDIMLQTIPLTPRYAISEQHNHNVHFK